MGFENFDVFTGLSNNIFQFLEQARLAAYGLGVMTALFFACRLLTRAFFTAFFGWSGKILSFGFELIALILIFTRYYYDQAGAFRMLLAAGKIGQALVGAFM